MSKPLTVQEVADLERVHHTTIRTEIQAGRLRARRVGRIYRIERTDYEAWKTAVTVSTSARPGRQRKQGDTFPGRLRAIEGGKA